MPGKYLKHLALPAISLCALLLIPISMEAQRGPGKGGKGGGQGGGGKNPWSKGAGKGDFKMPSLTVVDVKPEGAYEVYSLLPSAKDQPRLGVTDTMAWRLVDYSAEQQALKFVTLDMITGKLGSKSVTLPKDTPVFDGVPRLAYDGGEYAMVSYQACVLFVEVKTGKVKLASTVDASVPLKAPPPKRSRGPRTEESAGGASYRVHGGGGGKYALSVKTDYDSKGNRYNSRGATLFSHDGKSVTLDWDHNTYGIPPKQRDAVFSVGADEIVVLVTNPKKPGAFSSAHQLACLVFDGKGKLKEAQVNTEHWHGGNAPRASLSPDGKYIVAHPEDGLHRYVLARGTWARGYKTDYHDALCGFSPEGTIGVFVHNNTPKHAKVHAIELATGNELWYTHLTHEEVGGEGDDEPFTSVGPGARVVALQQGILLGQTSEDPVWAYKAAAVDFVPLSISYDDSGKKVAVLAQDRVFVLDAKSREELHSIPFPNALPDGSLGEFVTFDPKGNKVMACVRGRGVWLFDLATNTIEKTLPAIAGTWARAMPDFSGVVYSQAKEAGGNVMLQKLDGSEATRVYRCQYKDALAVCFWISEKGDRFLVAEREVGEGSLFLVKADGSVDVTYDVADADTMYVGDTTVHAFVTKSKTAVLINEINRWEYTGINCTVISPVEGTGIQYSFSGVFKSEELAGRSTYGQTAASPFFGSLHFGDEKNCRFACPAGVLEADISKASLTLHAWNRKPTGIAALNPKGKEFFVAGSNGLTTYRLK